MQDAGVIVPEAILLAIAAGSGLFIRNFYRDAPYFAAQAIGQDLVSFAVALPILLISAIVPRRGSGRAWRERRVARVFSALVRAFGTLAAACIIMTGVFSEDMMPMHSWFSIANDAAFGTAIALTGIACAFGAAIPKSLAVFCFVAWAVDIASAMFGQTRWLEWVVVGFLVVYLISISQSP